MVVEVLGMDEVCLEGIENRKKSTLVFFKVALCFGKGFGSYF